MMDYWNLDQSYLRNRIGLLLAVLLFSLFPFHFYIDASLARVNLSYGDGIVVFIGLLWILGLIGNYHLPRYITYIGAFLVVCLISLAVQIPDPASYFDLGAGIVSLIQFSGGVAWMVAVYLLSRDFNINILHYALLVSVFLATILSIVGIYQSMILNILRPVGTFQNPNLFANYLLLHVFGSLYISQTDTFQSSRVVRSFTITVTVILTVGILYTGSRGALIGLAAVLGLLFLLSTLHISMRTTITLIIGAISSVIIVLLYNPEIVERITSSRNLEERILLWETSLEAFLADPLLGIGYGQLSLYLNATIGREIDPHNTFALIAAETGIIGFVVFFGFIAIVLRDSISLSRLSIAPALLGIGVVGLLGQGLVTDIDNFRSFWIAIGLIAAHQERTTDDEINIGQVFINCVYDLKRYYMNMFLFIRKTNQSSTES